MGQNVGPNQVEVKETLTLKQFGQALKAQGTLEEESARQFTYELRIVHDVVFGTYQVKNATKGAISGSGTLLVRVSDDRKGMHGKCIWLDRETKKIEASQYDLIRV